MPYVYIIECSDKTFYTGYTTDISTRIQKHNDGLASRYTRGRTPVKLMYLEVCSTKSEAMKRELQLKTMTRAQKLDLINEYRIAQITDLIDATT